MASKRLGVGFIGSGFNTRFHMQAFTAVRDADGSRSHRTAGFVRRVITPNTSMTVAVRAGIRLRRAGVVPAAAINGAGRHV